MGGAPFRRVDHVQLAIPRGSEDEARSFYVDVLGLEEIPKPRELIARGGLWLRGGDVAIHLGVDPDFHPAAKAHPAFACADYPALLRRLQSHGVCIVSDEHPIEGKEHCYVADPFGNRIELIAGA